MPEELFEGIVTPLLIPLDKDEKIIEKDLDSHVRGLMNSGITAFLIPSGTGEFYNLTPEERRRATEIVVRIAKNKALIIAMVSDCGTRNTLRHIAAAREAGADAVMASPPYYVHVDQKGLQCFFNTLADEGGLPLWLYHQPFHTKITIEPQTVANLAKNPKIVGIKSSANVDICYFQSLLRALRQSPNFRVLMGEDINAVSGLVLGGHGMISTLSNLIPDRFLSIWESLKSHDLDRARQIQDHIAEVEQLVIPGWNSNWEAACKYVLKKRGVFSTTLVSSPLRALSEPDVERLEAIAPELGLW